MFRGTFTALVTPFRSDGALDEDALVRLVERQLESGIDGLVFFGTTGEEASLTLDERRRTIELVQKRAEGHMFLIAGAFDNVTERAVTLAREMDWLGVDAILSVVPYYTRPNQAGIIEHFRRIARLVSQIGGGLAAAHKKGILHRDVSPDNIMICAGSTTDRNAKLLDFGVAKAAGTPKSMATTTGMVFGKIGYASPELRAGEDGVSLETISHRLAFHELPHDVLGPVGQ